MVLELEAKTQIQPENHLGVFQLENQIGGVLFQ